MVNPSTAAAGAFQPGDFWRILAQARGPWGRWSSLWKCVNEPNGFPAKGPYTRAQVGRMYGHPEGKYEWDSRVVSVPASREPPTRSKCSDRMSGEPKRTEKRAKF
jgi:hypothetical protein